MAKSKKTSDDVAATAAKGVKSPEKLNDKEVQSVAASALAQKEPKEKKKTIIDRGSVEAAYSIGKIREVPLKGLDLTGIDLRAADLSEMDLTGTNFTGAVLQGVNFTDAKIKDANFEGADTRWTIGLELPEDEKEETEE